MAKIHPSAVVDSDTELADDVEIGPLCYIGPGVKIASGTRLIGHVTILGRTTIGRDNVIWPNATLGGDPQDRKYQGGPTALVIGDDNSIRESVTIHRGTEHGDRVTRIGNHNMIMFTAHIAHDCVIGDHVTLGNVTLAGHICVEDHVVIGGASAAHHFVTVGRHAYVGGMTRLVHDVPPYMVTDGSPARVRGINSVGLARNGFETEDVEIIRDAYRRLYRSNGVGVGQTTDALAGLEHDYPQNPHINCLIESLRNTSLGVHGRFRESMRSDSHRAARREAT